MVKDCIYKGRDVQSQLRNKHKWEAPRIKTTVSDLLQKVKHICLLDKRGSYLPGHCNTCNKSVTRMDLHLVNYHGLNREEDEYENALLASKISCVLEGLFC